MKLTDIYNQNKTILSFEIFPPKKDEELDNIDPTLEILSDLHPDYISVTFGAGGLANNSKTISLAKKIKDTYHTEPVVHLTGLYYDKNEIDDFAKEIKDAGIDNILALRGDINPNVPKKDVFPHASDLIVYLKEKYGQFYASYSNALSTFEYELLSSSALIRLYNSTNNSNVAILRMGITNGKALIQATNYAGDSQMWPREGVDDISSLQPGTVYLRSDACLGVKQ